MTVTGTKSKIYFKLTKYTLNTPPHCNPAGLLFYSNHVKKYNLYNNTKPHEGL